jgi:hypothetical protein
MRLEYIQDFHMQGFAYKITLKLTLATIWCARASNKLKREKEREEKGCDFVEAFGRLRPHKVKTFTLLLILKFYYLCRGLLRVC